MFKIILSAIFISFVLAEAYALKPKLNGRSGPACELCTLVLGYAKTLLQKNETDDKIIQTIEKELCGRLGPLNGTCVNLLETSGRQILADLASGLDPATVCKKFSLCITSTKGLSEYELFFNEKNSLNCTVCKLVMSQIQNLLNGNATEAQIIQFLDKDFCSHLGPLNTVCQALVNQYGPEAIKLLSQKIDPEKVCELIGMCTNKTLTRQAMKHKLQRTPKKMRANPIECELCTLVLGYAKTLLQKNETDDKIIQTIEKELCGRLGPLNATCVNLMETSGRQILDDLAGGLDPATVCKKFSLCATASKLTFDHLNANPLECTVCQYVIQFLDVELKGNKTEAAIVNALKNVCNFTPASLKAECQSLVNSYGIYLVQLLMEFADPLKVCQAIKVC